MGPVCADSVDEGDTNDSGIRRKRKLCSLREILVGMVIVFFFFTYFYYNSTVADTLYNAMSLQYYYKDDDEFNTSTTTNAEIIIGYEQIDSTTDDIKVEKIGEFKNNTDANENVIKDGWVVWSPSCRIPNISANHESIRKFIHKKKPIVCSTHKKALTEIRYNGTTRLHYISIQQNLMSEYIRSIAGSNNRKKYKCRCCYSQITRTSITKSVSPHDDDRLNVGKAVCFNTSTVLPKDTEFVYVNCYAVRETNGNREPDIRGNVKKNSKSSLDVYKNVHGIVPVKERLCANNLSRHQRQLIERLWKQANMIEHKDGALLPSVLLFGIDSVSRLNIIRSMPNTVKYLNSNGWIGLEGYTKVALNTFPNLIPILTGMTEGQFEKKCWAHRTDKLDDCPFIWKEFKNRSYVTAYAEDEPEMSTFNYHKYGFMESPTDYYTRPFFLAAQKLLKVKVMDGLKYCLGPSATAEHILKYCKDFVTAFDQMPYFALFWTNTFSHNDVNEPTLMDNNMRDFFKDINGSLHSTIVIFLSDHGMRWGPIRQTFVGWHEDRMPFIYVWLPPSFRNRYPDKYANLVVNKNRLTSPFDLHLTLRDILHLNDGANSNNVGAAGCDSCGSLFEKVKWNRTCEEAGIASSWCTCSTTFEQVDVDDHIIKSAVDFIVKYVNAILMETNEKYIFKKGLKCAPLNLKMVISVRRRVRQVSTPGDQYIIVIQTKPGDAIFEVAIGHSGSENSFFVDTISRINAYGTQSHCVNNAKMKMYCLCIS